MSWENILKAGLSAMHFRNLKKAVVQLSDTHSDLLENASMYKEEIVELAITNFVEEAGERPLRLKYKYDRMFDRVIARIVNSISSEKSVKQRSLELLNDLPKIKERDI